MKFRQSGHNQDEPTSLYVLECAGRVKIGIAANVAKRVEHLQMACPVRINVAHERRFPTRTLARLAERSLHLKHSEVRLWGEWFEMDVAVAIAAVIAVEQQAAPVRIAARHAVAPPRLAEPPAPKTVRAAVRPSTGYAPTWEEYEAMTDDVWIEHMRPAALALDFSLPSDERLALIAAAEADLAAKYAA